VVHTGDVASNEWDTCEDGRGANESRVNQEDIRIATVAVDNNGDDGDARDVEDLPNKADFSTEGTSGDDWGRHICEEEEDCDPKEDAGRDNEAARMPWGDTVTLLGVSPKWEAGWSKRAGDWIQYWRAASLLLADWPGAAAFRPRRRLSFREIPSR